MKLLVQEDLKPLVTDHGFPCISIYMPTLRGRENQQNAIRFKNLCGRAREHLVASGMRTSQAQEHMAALEKMMVESDLWRSCSDGLAVFQSQSQLRWFRLPQSFGEIVVVSDRFHLKPIVPLLAGGGFLYLLAMNLRGVRLFHCTADSFDEVDLSGRMPASLEESMGAYVLEESVQFHTVASTTGRPTGIMHGHGATGADEAVRKKYILEYFRQVDRGLVAVLNHSRAPMLLAGVKYLCSLYRQANRYPNLLEAEVSGSIEMTSLKDLHRRAWEAYKPVRSSGQCNAVGRFHEAAATPRGSTRLERIVPAAYNGQVATLLTTGSSMWGRFDPASGQVEVHDSQKYGEEDLVDFAAVHTLMHGGEVYSVGPADLGAAPMAAILRYA